MQFEFVVGGVVFSDYRVSPNFLVVLGLRLWLRLGLGCDNGVIVCWSVNGL